MSLSSRRELVLEGIQNCQRATAIAVQLKGHQDPAVQQLAQAIHLAAFGAQQIGLALTDQVLLPRVTAGTSEVAASGPTHHGRGLIMPMNGKHTVDRQAPALEDPVQVIGLVDQLVQDTYRRVDKIQDQHKRS